MSLGCPFYYFQQTVFEERKLSHEVFEEQKSVTKCPNILYPFLNLKIVANNI